MIKRYVKTLTCPVFEATTPQETAHLTAKKKYEDAKKKDEQQYKQYVDGAITKDQYMQWFEQLLAVEREYRLAQINYKIASGRGSTQQQQQGKPQKTQQQQELPGTQ